MAHPAAPLFDADNHYYETRDCFTRHMPKALQDRAIRVTPDAQGRDRIWVGERPFTFLENWSFTHANRPGALRELLRQKDYRDEASGLSAAKAEAEEAIPAPVGKLLLLSTRAQCCSSAIWRTRSRTTLTRSRLLPYSGIQLIGNLSFFSQQDRKLPAYGSPTPPGSSRSSRWQGCESVSLGFPST